MSAKARRLKRERERLTVKAKRQIRELDHVILAAQRVATAEWWGGPLETAARKHFAADGTTKGAKLTMLVNMVGADYVRFTVHYLLIKERTQASGLIEVLNFDPELVAAYVDVVGGSNEELEVSIKAIEERLTSIGYDVAAERARLVTKLAAGRRSA